MITKERLEELIEKGATIYWLIDNKIRELPCKDIPTFWIKDNYNDFDRPFFETKENAEEYAEFGNITRTERLDLPMWEEACDGVTHNVPFTTPNHLKIEMLICDEHIDIISIYNSIMDYSKPLTRENYNEARRLCVKLFKGEEV